jgi:PhnB protein
MPTTTTTRTSLRPYLIVDGAAAAIDFYREAFGAVETFRLDMPDGRVGHAELEIDGAAFDLADEYPEMGYLGPISVGSTTVTLHLEVPDVDAFAATAVEAGATLERPPSDQFHGNRSATIVDPFGHRWSVQTRIEDVSIDEMRRRLDELEDEG